jgi:type III secretion protein J
VSQIDGILSARVLVVLPDNDLLKRVISPSSASVLVRYDPAIDINQLIPQIKTLIANGISGLNYDGVSVTAIKAADTHARASNPPPMASFLGIWMLEDDVPGARLKFGALLVCILGLAGVLGWQQWQRRRADAVYVLEDAR